MRDLTLDNVSSSTDLAFKVIEFYSNCRDCSAGFMENSRTGISDSHIGLGLVRNCNEILFKKWVELEGDIQGECDYLKDEIQKQTDLSIRNAGEVIPDGATVVTLSNSSAVRKALLRHRSKLQRVYVLESRPGLEGREMASALERGGVDSILIADAAIQQASILSDIALCGSDSILSDWALIHKIGTYPLFLEMNRMGKKTFSMTIGLKSENSFISSTYPVFREHDPRELTPKGKALNIYFDKTPVRLVSGFVSDKGLLQKG